MKYLVYNAKESIFSGLSDRRACLSRLLAEAKLTNRIAVIPKFQLMGYHNRGISFPSYLIGEYFKIERLGVQYITIENFRTIQFNENDIQNIDEFDGVVYSDVPVIVRNFRHDTFFLMIQPEINEIAKNFHAFGSLNTIPLYTPTDSILNKCNRVMELLPRPTIGISLRRIGRLNHKLDRSMTSQSILKKIERFNYKSVFWCSDDDQYQLEGDGFYSHRDFYDIFGDIVENYMLFSVEMSILCHCDIAVRTFIDSYIYFHKDIAGENYSIADYSMHVFKRRETDIPLELIKQEYVDNKY